MLPKIYLCPTDKKYACSWEGAAEDILEHFTEEHEELLSFSNVVPVDLRVSSENKLVFFDEEIYLHQAKTDGDHLYVFLRYLGPETIASKITFDLELEHEGRRLDKKWITVRCGYFAVSLESVRLFADTNSLNCVLSVSGDFRIASGEEEYPSEEVSNDSTDGERGLHNGVAFYDPSPTDSGISMADSLNHPLKRQASLDDIKTRSGEKACDLTRSKTFNFEEIRRKTPARRHPSTASLESIKEDERNPELLCTNCESVMNPPIFLCISGHNFCTSCGLAKRVCVVCDERITEERNLDLEEKSINHTYACRNRKLGCSKKLPYLEMRKHEVNCKYCLYKCPVEECGYTAQFKNMHHHLKLIHSSTKLLDTFIVGFQKHSEAFLASEDKGFFYCRVSVANDTVVWEAKFCGPKEREFFCELKFKERGLKTPQLLRNVGDAYRIEIPSQELKRMRVKPKNAFLTITR
ncbi:uncharacterized protein LOC132700736 [Cylas formicarius]|uniref:uncharacterized protein LOC132700736 n=1 Tax=Cylas formicarius TaxID=197179 RepID=UPI002958773A|nr:uncharacterized protein LOC132700736 [Cylas formicarius]